jgi:hypothetical protein
MAGWGKKSGRGEVGDDDEADQRHFEEGGEEAEVSNNKGEKVRARQKHRAANHITRWADAKTCSRYCMSGAGAAHLLLGTLHYGLS